ncbi:MAG: hypothetical protein PUK14_03850 [Clostridiales bacterium]|nr:hypothetical protein [Clostridiales bacterium]MDY6116646.1 hypothetical protein [Anaerovoracaceae bacterium]
MNITIQTDLGEISVEKNYFAQKILSVLMQVRWRGRFYHANYKSKLLVEENKPSLVAFSDVLEVSEINNGIYLSIPLIADFGMPLKSNTSDLIKDIFLEFGKMDMPIKKITVHIVGVKSKHVAPRNIKFTVNRK